MPQSSPPGRAHAAAPCSVGVGPTPTPLIGAERLTSAMAGAGYQGLDLGPPPYLAEGGGLVARLGAHGIGLAGGWVTVADPWRDQAEQDAELDAVLDALTTGAAQRPDLPRPRPTLAGPEPADARLGAPVTFTGEPWDRFIDGLQRAVARCRDRGLEPVLHPHVGTVIETPADTERVLSATDVDLCFDTGHTHLGGGDVPALLDAWAARITHLHLKDIDAAMAQALRESRAEPKVTWTSRVFRRIGDGDLDWPDLLGRMDGFRGWVVVEQDAAVADEAEAVTALDDQAASLDALRELGW